MKTIIILIICLTSLWLYIYNDMENRNQKLSRELHQTQDSLRILRKEYKDHMRRCAFISTASIEKISKDGRFITLYQPVR